jgi:FkbM family methyltransferase
VHGLLKRLRRRWQPYLIEVVEDALGNRTDVFFVQIGANDGQAGDPLHELIRRSPAWRGLLIEPVPYVFARLKQSHPDGGRFVCENVAIGAAAESRDFYYVSDRARDVLGSALPATFDQLGSFDPHHIRKHCGPEIEPFIVRASIRTEPLRDVLGRHRVSRVDVLHIDTEGYDYQILRQVDFAAWPPAVILYEHSHLSHSDQAAAVRLLGDHGYRVRSFKTDTLATRVT